MWGRSIPGKRGLLLETDVKAQYAKPGYLLFVRGSALVAQTIDVGATRLSGEVTSIADDIWYDAGGGLSDFAVTEGTAASTGNARETAGNWPGSIVPAEEWRTRARLPITYTRGCRRTRSEPSWRWSIRIPGRTRSGCWTSCAARARGSSPEPRRAIGLFGPPMAVGSVFSSDRSGPWSLFGRGPP